MPAKNLYHDSVVAGLIEAGWTITDDPLTLTIGFQSLHIDLGVQAPTIVAEQAGRKVAIEIQSFIGDSAINDLHRAVGQCLIYKIALEQERPGLPLFMAVPDRVYGSVFEEPLGRLIREKLIQRIMVFESTTGRIMQWIE